MDISFKSRQRVINEQEVVDVWSIEFSSEGLDAEL